MDIEKNQDLEPEIQSETVLDDDLASLDMNLEEENTDSKPASEQTEDLEKYGVWVKVEPSDVADTEMAKEESSFDLEDLETDEMEPPAAKPAEPEQDVQEIEEVDFDVDTETPEQGAEEDLSAVPDTGEEETALDFDEDLSGLTEEPLDELSAGTPELESDLELEEEPAETEQTGEDELELAMEEEPAPALEAETAEQVKSETEGDIEEVSLDDLGISIDAESPEEQEKKSFETSPMETEEFAIHDAVPVDSDDVVPPLDIDLELGEDETGADTDEAAGEEIIFEEPDLEQEEMEETQSTGGAQEEEEELASLDLPEETEGEALEDLPELDVTSPDATGGLELEEIGEEEQVEEPAEEIEVPLSEEPNIAEPLEGLDEIERGAAVGEAEPAGAGAEPSPQILLQIEDELKSIKTELTTLKKEIGALRVQKPLEQAGRPETEKADEMDETSFFEEGEEEDETIALTGEELDNILVTAEIKEEQEEESGEVPEEAEQLVDQEDILDYQDTEKEQAVEALDELEELSTEGLEMEEPGPEEEQADQFGEIEMGTPLETETAAEEAAPAEPSDEIEIEIPDLEEEQAPGGQEHPALDLDIQTSQETAPSPMEEAPEEEISDLSIEPLAEAETGEQEESTLDLELEEVPTESIAAQEEEKQKADLNPKLKEELKSVLGYMDQLLESLPEEKIQEFARSEYFEVYKRLFEELGLAS
jgi:pilus assembly protein FimV